MLRNPYLQLICVIFRVINRNRNDSFDCHALTSQSSTFTHAVGMYACRRVWVTGNMTRIHPRIHIGPPQIQNKEHIIKYTTSEKRLIRKTLQSCKYLQYEYFECCDQNDWDLNEYFNCSSPSPEACGVPFSCCMTKDERINS